MGMGKVLEVPPQSGDVNLEGFFPGKVVVVDDLFRRFVNDTVGSRYSTNGFSCGIMDPVSGVNNDDRIVRLFGFNVIADGTKVCAMLAYLGGEGWYVLDIPPGEEEVNLILGYVAINIDHLVLFVEHEIEDGVEEIHLHARPLNKWGKDAPMVAIIG